MKLSTLVCLFTTILTLHPHAGFAKLATSGNKPPVNLPNGRDGSRPIAVYQLLNEVAFEITSSQPIMVFTTTNLNLSSCTSSSVEAARCPYTEAAAGVERISIIDVRTNRIVSEEIFDYSQSSTAYFPTRTPEVDRPSIGSGGKRNSTLHFVSSLLPTGSYKARLEIRNDFRPIVAHPKRISVVFE